MGDGVSFSIMDNGRGMSDDLTREKTSDGKDNEKCIFNEVSHKDSTGLGIAHVNKRAPKAGGGVSVESQDNNNFSAGDKFVTKFTIFSRIIS